MKKFVFLMISAMAILFCGCSTSSGLALPRTVDTGNSQIGSHARPPQVAAHGGRVHMPFTTHSSVEINVKCIFSYVKGDASSDAADEPNDTLNPWVRFNYSF